MTQHIAPLHRPLPPVEDTTETRTEAPQTLARVEDLHISFLIGGDLVEVVHGIDFEVRAGECVALVGESGSGKTVSARTLIGLSGAGAVVTAADISVAGSSVMSLDTRQWQRLRGATVGLVLQDALVSFDPLRTVGAEVSEPLRIHRTVGKDEVTSRMHALLQEAGIPDPVTRAEQYSHQLSGGLRQRALIASAVAAEPELLIADEPTTALDVTVQAQVLDLLAARKLTGTGILLISHDLAVVSKVADRVYVMRFGEIVESGPTAEVLGNPRHAYTQALLAADPVAHEKGTRLSGDRVGERFTVAARSDEVVLEATGLTKRFALPGGRVKVAVDDVGFTLHRGEALGVVGESGSGKSTTARIALALEQPDEGEVRLLGEPWTGIPEQARRARRHRMQVIYQDPLSSFDPRFTVERLIGEALLLRGVPRKEHHRRTVDLLDKVGLPAHLVSQRPLRMSGGQRQRVAIARALAMEPEIIVADEAVSALDVSVQAQVLDLMSDLQAELGVSYLFISHHLGVVRHMCDRVLVMKDGVCVESGPVEQVFDDPEHPYTQALIASIPRLETGGGDAALARDDAAHVPAVAAV